MGDSVVVDCHLDSIAQTLEWKWSQSFRETIVNEQVIRASTAGKRSGNRQRYCVSHHDSPGKDGGFTGSLYVECDAAVAGGDCSVFTRGDVLCTFHDGILHAVGSGKYIVNDFDFAKIAGRHERKMVIEYLFCYNMKQQKKIKKLRNYSVRSNRARSA